jgi:hypothetical protein
MTVFQYALYRSARQHMSRKSDKGRNDERRKVNERKIRGNPGG